MISIRSLALATRSPKPWLPALLLVSALAACDDPGDDVDDPAGHRETLEAQRAEVRELVATLAAEAATALGGRVSTASGHWEGCDSVFPEGHRNFHYRAAARIDAGRTAARPYLDVLGPALGTAGLARAAAGERPGGRTLGGSVDEVEVRFSELPGQGDYVLLDVSGPCVDVPEGDRDEWEGRPDPAPIVE